MSIAINCKAIAEKIEAEAREMATNFFAMTGRHPMLMTIIANDDPASKRYVRNKMRACERCGIAHEGWTLADSKEIGSALWRYSQYASVDGVMLQLPVCDGLNANELIQMIDPAKDVDCLTSQNMGKLALGDNSFMPATVAGIMRLFKEEGYDLKGKIVVIRGRSNIVGKPLALAMINAGATVVSENSHSDTVVENTLGRDIYDNKGSYYMSSAIDVVVDATGKKRRWNPSCDYYIDVTTIVDEDGKLHGSYIPATENVGKYTSVPGGVGLLTCACLAWNTAYLACKQAGIEV